jgi:hypothetical protein
MARKAGLSVNDATDFAFEIEQSAQDQLDRTLDAIAKAIEETEELA